MAVSLSVSFFQVSAPSSSSNEDLLLTLKMSDSHSPSTGLFTQSKSFLFSDSERIKISEMSSNTQLR